MTQLLLVTPVVPSVSHSTQVVTMVLLYTGIDDLYKLKMFLKSVVDWQSLGLALGLLYPTLEIIEKEQRGVVEQCKTKLLAAWLQQQDSVSMNSAIPSWSVLRRALMSIGENELASSCSEI